MSAPWVWAELDLARTADTALIRRAYARRLKIVHPEDDGPGFQRLREAYDKAMAWAAYAPEDLGAPEAPEATPLDPPAPIRHPDSQAAEGVSGPEPEPDVRLDAGVQPPTADPLARLNADIQRLVALLSTLADPDSLVQVFAEIVANPVMENLGVETQTETALSDLIARSLPRSDVLIEPAVARFGWRDDDGARPPSPAVAFLLRRRFELAHEAKLGRLESSLTNLGATSDATSQALADVLNSPALQDLGIYGRTEAWIAALIARNTPQSDPLVEHVVRRFGWTDARTDLAGIPIVLGRLRGLARNRTRTRTATTGGIRRTPHLGPIELPRLSLRAWYGIAFFALVILSAVFRNASQDQMIHIAPVQPESIAVGPGRVVSICRVNAQHGLSECRIVLETAPAQHLGPRALDFLERRVKLPSPTVPLDAQYVATADFDAVASHDPKLSLTSVQAGGQPAGTWRGPGRVVMSCRVSPRHGLETCAVLSEIPKGRGLGAEALRVAMQNDGWLTKAPVGTATRAYATFSASGQSRVRATWRLPSTQMSNPEPTPEPPVLKPTPIFSDPQPPVTPR